MLALKPDTRLILGEDIMIQTIPELDHYYAFNVKNGDHFEINHTACWVLESISSGTSFQQLVDKFARTFDLRQDTAQEDLSEIIQNAFMNHIIKEVGT